MGQRPSTFKSGRHDTAFYNALWACLHRTGHWRGEIWNKRKNGEIFPERMSLSAVKDRHGKTRLYYRPPGGKRIPLPDESDSGFLAAYEAAVATPPA